MAVCKTCGKDFFRIQMVEGTCLQCIEDARALAASVERIARERTVSEANERAAVEAIAASRIILTTESSSNLPVSERLDIITAEVVIGMHLFKDIASAFRDTFGGRSATMQKGLRDARKTALDELRREALALGADAVVAIDLDYSEISGGGKSMLFLVASGTAVKLTSADGTKDRA